MEKKMDELLQKAYDKVVGRRNEILMIISALRAEKHLFLEGPPGTSKSTILKTISEYSGTPFCLVTGNSDLTTSKLIGFFDPAKTLSEGYLREHFNPGALLQAMIDGMYLYIEEFNRLPDETTNVFITVMSENKLSVPRFGVVEPHPNFRIIAALNPLDDIGISRISRALKDRFCSIKMNYQTKFEEIRIVEQNVKIKDKKLIEIAVDIARETRMHPDLKLGASVRASIDMVKIYSEVSNTLRKNNLIIDGEDYLLNSALMAFRDKIWLYETSERTPEEIIKEIFNKLTPQSRVKKKP